MKKQVTVILLSALVLSGCASGRMGNPGAIAAGASIGGSLGSVAINKAVRASLDVLLQRFQIIHLCGKGNVEESLEGRKGYKQFE